MAGYDQLFKTLFRTFFGDLLTLLDTRAAASCDGSRAVFLDKELFTEWPRGQRREADLLTRVPLRGEPGGSILVHVEIEARARRSIGARLRSYCHQIRSAYDDQVLSAVVFLSGGKPGVHFESLREDLKHLELARFGYFAFGVAGCQAEEYLARPEPLAWGLAALMRRGSWSRAAHKLACLRRIHGAELSDLQRLSLVNCVETYLELTTAEAAEYDSLLSPQEKEERAMKIAKKMTWADRLRNEGWQEGREQGRQEGVQQGMQKGQTDGVRRMLIRQLTLRFGQLPAPVRKRVAAIDSLEILTDLAERVLTARSLQDLGLA